MIILYSLFVLSACCYILFLLSDPLEEIGGNIGKSLKLPEAVIASTFQALATSGPEILISVITATAFITTSWSGLGIGEKACSGLLNMSFSAMDNLVGIGCVGLLIMIYKGYVDKHETIIVGNNVIKGLLLYIIASTLLCIFIYDDVMSVVESWILLGVMVSYIVSQFFTNTPKCNEKINNRFGQLVQNGFLYSFIVFALILFVKECLKVTFDLSSLGIVSIGGVLLAITSYVSSFPEFMLTCRYALKDKKDAMLGMLFGSNIIDLGFSGFRPIWTNESMEVYTTGKNPELLFGYLVCLPIIAILTFIGLKYRWIKYSIAYPMSVFYIVYVLSGLVLL